MELLMQNLINELTQPRPPSAASLRAAKALQELATLHQADLKGRLEAERKLVEAYGEIQKLQGLLNEKSNTNTVTDMPTDAVSESTETKVQRDEVPG
jgi:hypothetical protein